MVPQIAHSVVSERSLADLTATPASGNGVKDRTSQPVLEPGEQRLIVLAVMPTETACTALIPPLGDASYELCAAWTTHKALALAEQAPVDVVVLDLDGRYEAGVDGVEISGFRLLHLLWRHTRERPIALVVISALDYTEVEGPVRASADDFINKPVVPVQLLCRLRGALGRVRARHRQGGAPGPYRWCPVSQFC